MVSIDALVRSVARLQPLQLRTAGVFLAFCLLCHGSGDARGQQSPAREIRPPIQLQTEQAAPVQAPAAAEPASPNLTPAALPIANPTQPLGERLAACDQASANSEALALPSQRGEVKLDRCFRGRDHLVCGFNALLAEAKILLQNYRRIVDADYANVGDVEGICRRQPDRLMADLQSTIEFTTRYRTLKAEYESRSNCATRVQQSFRDVAFPDMAQGPSILKSMIEAIETDVKGLAATQAQVTELSAGIEVSQRAIGTLQKLHRSICAINRRAGTDAEGRASR